MIDGVKKRSLVLSAKEYPGKSPIPYQPKLEKGFVFFNLKIKERIVCVMIINQNDVGMQVLIEGDVQVNVVVHADFRRSNNDEQSEGTASEDTDRETQVIAVEMDGEKPLEISAAKSREEQLEEKLQELIKKFCVKKIGGIRLKNAYMALAEKCGGDKINAPKVNRLLGKAERVEQCGTWLEFWLPADMSAKRLIHANFCRDRLCMMCAWRRSKKAYMQNRECFDRLIGQGKFILLTLTAKNVKGEDLGKEITKYSDAFRGLVKDKLVKRNVLGWMRTLEVTYNQEMDTYHPHIHALLHVRKNYFSQGYLSHGKWKELWEQYAGLDYSSQVRVNVVKKRADRSMQQVLVEVSKYCVKFSDLDKLSEEKFVDVVGVLDRALYNRRLITYGGSWRQVRKDLHQKEDLENYEVDEDKKIDSGYRILYEWIFGENRYEMKSVKRGADKIFCQKEDCK